MIVLLRQAEAGFEEDGLDADSRSPLSPSAGGIRGGPGHEGGFDDSGSLELATSERMANTKDKESLAFFQVISYDNHQARKFKLAWTSSRTVSSTVVLFYHLYLVSRKRFLCGKTLRSAPTDVDKRSFAPLKKAFLLPLCCFLRQAQKTRIATRNQNTLALKQAHRSKRNR